MSKPNLIAEQWEVSGAGLLDTREVFARIAARELNTQNPCRSPSHPEWAPLKMRFSMIKSDDDSKAYGLVKKLGEGAFGTVYLAFDALAQAPGKTGRLVALKCPTPALLQRFVKQIVDEDRSENEQENLSAAKLRIGQFFSQEAALTARLAMSAHVVKVLDHDVTVPYIALEYCNGGCLTDQMKRPFEMNDVIQGGLEIASALDAAHSLEPDQLIHRDLKPDNILIHDGVMKISDFGTAQLVNDLESLKSLRGGYTPLYGAPEAFDGRAYPATDIWSFGVILYELICGERPFASGVSFAAMARAIIDKDHTPLQQKPGITAPQELYDFIECCLSKDHEDRPTAAQAVALFSKLSFASAKTQLDSEDRQFGNQCKEKIDGGSQSRSLSATIATAAFVFILVVASFIYFAFSSSQAPTVKSRAPDVKSTDTAAKEQFQRSDMGILNNRRLWNRASFEKQDWVIKELRKSLSPEYRWVETDVYQCGNLKHRIATFEHVGTGLLLNLIPGGTFSMGSRNGDWKGLWKEQPAHTVTVKPLLIGRHEVRQEIWDELGGADSRGIIGAQLPIDSANWHEVKDWLKSAGDGLRLPSEAEWEYACRAGSDTTYYWGDEMDQSHSWTKLNSSDIGYAKSRDVNLHFQSRKWNAFGLVDMSGNVWEWIEDSWTPNYENAPKTEKAVEGKSLNRPIRGGCWINDAVSARSARRNDYQASERFIVIGFRVAKTVPFQLRGS